MAPEGAPADSSAKNQQDTVQRALTATKTRASVGEAVGTGTLVHSWCDVKSCSCLGKQPGGSAATVPSTHDLGQQLHLADTHTPRCCPGTRAELSHSKG